MILNISSRNSSNSTSQQNTSSFPARPSTCNASLSSGDRRGGGGGGSEKASFNKTFTSSYDSTSSNASIFGSIPLFSDFLQSRNSSNVTESLSRTFSLSSSSSSSSMLSNNNSTSYGGSISYPSPSIVSNESLTSTLVTSSLLASSSTPPIPSSSSGVSYDIGIAQLQGRRAYMEDRFIKENNLIHFANTNSIIINDTKGRSLFPNILYPDVPQSVKVYGVFDGHGGSNCVNYIAANVLRVLVEAFVHVSTVSANMYRDDTLIELLGGRSEANDSFIKTVVCHACKEIEDTVNALSKNHKWKSGSCFLMTVIIDNKVKYIKKTKLISIFS